VAIGDKWRKWQVSEQRFHVARGRHPRVLSAEQQALKELREANLAKLKAQRAERIAKRRNPKR
jgi:hypothetical protein